MTKNHLLYWMFKVLDNQPEGFTGIENICEGQFKEVNAPVWAWMAFQDSLIEYRKEK